MTSIQFSAYVGGARNVYVDRYCWSEIAVDWLGSPRSGMGVPPSEIVSYSPSMY